MGLGAGTLNYYEHMGSGGWSAYGSWLLVTQTVSNLELSLLLVKLNGPQIMNCPRIRSSLVSGKYRSSRDRSSGNPAQSIVAQEPPSRPGPAPLLDGH